MRRGLIYLLSIALAIGIIHLVIRYGNGISAPAALPANWSFAAGPATSCPLFSTNSGAFKLSQSGEIVSVVFSQVESFEMHGKLDREGKFRLAGKVPRGRFPNCYKGSLVWEGNATPGSMNGDFAVAGPECAPCSGKIQVSGVPQP